MSINFTIFMAVLWTMKVTAIPIEQIEEPEQESKNETNICCYEGNVMQMYWTKNGNLSLFDANFSEPCLSDLKTGYQNLKSKVQNQFEVAYSALKTQNELIAIENSDLISKVNSMEDEISKLQEKVESFKEPLLKYLAENIRDESFEAGAKLIEMIYDEDVDGAIAIMRYIRESPALLDITQLFEGYKMLYNEMEKQRHLDTYQAYFLQGRLQELIDMENFEKVSDDYKGEITKLYDKIFKKTELVKKDWKEDILNSEHYHYILDIAKNNLMEFVLITYDLIPTIYSNDRMVIQKIINFANDLQSLDETFFIFIRILVLMQNNNFIDIPEAITLAYRIKNFDSFDMTDDFIDENRNLYDDMKATFPNGIRNLVWESVCIKNTQTSEYLAPLNVNSSVVKNVTMSEKCSKWTFETSTYGKYFHIVNTESGEYLYAGSDSEAKDDTKRRLFMGNDLKINGTEWMVELREKGSRFFIKNKLYDEYLIGDPMILGMAFTYREKNVKILTACWTFELE